MVSNKNYYFAGSAVLCTLKSAIS